MSEEGIALEGQAAGASPATNDVAQRLATLEERVTGIQAHYATKAWVYGAILGVLVSLGTSVASFFS